MTPLSGHSSELGKGGVIGGGNPLLIKLVLFKRVCAETLFFFTPSRKGSTTLSAGDGTFKKSHTCLITNQEVFMKTSKDLKKMAALNRTVARKKERIINPIRSLKRAKRKGGKNGDSSTIESSETNTSTEN